MAGDGGNGEIIMRLPENCISYAISLTSPADSCRSSAVCTTFLSAVDSDIVWRRFLPADYEEILARAVDPEEFSSKKELYFRLCDSILVDGGKMSFSLERSTGRKCYTLSARELVIIWGDTPRYLKWKRRVDSRFSEVAELLDICWPDIRGMLDSKLLTPRTNYAAFLIFKLAPDTSGFGFPSQYASVRAGTQNSHNEVCLKPGVRRTCERWAPYMYVEVTSTGRTPHARADGWMELELGEFFSGDGDEGEVEILFWETESRRWRSLLIIEGIEVRPK